MCDVNILIWKQFYLPYLDDQEVAGREEAECETAVNHLQQLSLVEAGWLMNVHSLFQPLLFAL